MSEAFQFPRIAEDTSEMMDTSLLTIPDLTQDARIDYCHKICRYLKI